jgi:hypothetical protein
MKILSVRRFDRDDLLGAIARVPLRGFDGALPFRNATVRLNPAVVPDVLAPAQGYVLRPTVATVLAMRAALLDVGIDFFALDGGAYVRTSDAPDEVIPVIPPIVEESREPDGRTVSIISDGLHRVFAARSLGLPVSVVHVSNVPPEYPYYAYALADGWSAVDELDELPDNYQKKQYRQPDNYKALFRDYNALFPGVQKQRKKSNPEHIRA